MFVSIYGRFETPHEVELVRSALINQGVPTADISLMREENAVLVHTEPELQDDVCSLMKERGAQDLNIRSQPMMDRGLEQKEIWQGRKKPVSTTDAEKMPHAGPLETR